MTDGTSKPEMVFESIRDKIAAGELPNRARLASVTRLAEEYAVSRSTVQKALALLAAGGLVRRRRGSGVYVISECEAERDAADHGAAAEKVADQLAADIVNGHYATGAFLPLRKVLQFQYHTSPAVIRAALDLVERRGLVHRKGTSYLVGLAAANSVPTECRVITVLNSLAQVETLLNWRVSRAFVRSLEKELNRYGITQLRSIDPEEEDVRAVSHLTRADTVGFVYLGTGAGFNGPSAARLQRFLNAASLTGLPVVHFNYGNTLYTHPGLSLTIRENDYLIVVDNGQGGESVGAYLASLGHESVAFFGYFTDSNWNTERFRGFVRGYKRVLRAGSRITYFRRKPEDLDKQKKSAAGELIRQAQEAIERVFEQHAFTTVDPTRDIMHRLTNYVTADDFRRIMAPHFRKALARRDITAWACASEVGAIAAAEFLRREGVRVPEDISLIGINNDEDSVVYGLTMYDFQKDRMGYLAAHCFLGDLPLKRDRRGVLHTPGRIVVRRSTARRS